MTKNKFTPENQTKLLSQEVITLLGQLDSIKYPSDKLDLIDHIYSTIRTLIAKSKLLNPTEREELNKIAQILKQIIIDGTSPQSLEPITISSTTKQSILFLLDHHAYSTHKTITHH